MMISLGITNPLAAFVNRQPESINLRDARFPAVALLHLPATSLLCGAAPWGTSFPLSLGELCTLALAFTRAGDPVWKAAGNWDASDDRFLGSRRNEAVFASKAKHFPQSVRFGSRQFSRTVCVSNAWSFIRARCGVHLGFKACSKITFQTSEKLQFNLVVQKREMRVEGEEVWEYCDLQALQITFRDVPKAPCLSRSLQVISGQVSHAAQCYSHSKCGR